MPRNKDDFQELIKQDRSEYVLQLVVPDTRLQSLVDHFSSLNYRLMSPAAPQPGQSHRIKLTGKLVQYEIDFVQK